MNRPARSFKHWRGQVAIIVAIVLGLLILMVGLVVDLGFLYTRKTELQNAADAAALAGAKKLNGSAPGITAAVDHAIALAALNSVNFGNDPLSGKNALTEEANIWFANTPDGNDTNNDGVGDGGWSTPDQARTSPADKYFIKVDTTGIGLSTVQTWFMRVAGQAFERTSTYGLAVAGPFTVDVAPIGVCAIDKDAADYGFLRGVAYNLPDVNPLASGDPIWLHPSATTEDGCKDSQANADFPLPFICQGKMAYMKVPGIVFTNTGVTAGKGEAALNSRFGGNNKSPYEYARDLCPPDSNIKQYSVDAPLNAPDTADAINPGVWMVPDPTQQTITIEKKTGKPLVSGFSDYGVLWSYARPASATIADWPTLYGGDAENYPETSPYSQTTGKFFKAPTADQGLSPAGADRRVLNIIIVDCEAVTAEKIGGVCNAIPTLAIGRFFMQREADLPHDIEAEFIGITSNALPPEIRLFR